MEIRNTGKPIFDPFAGQEVKINIPEEFNQSDRRTYDIHRPCGHCRGNGKSRGDKSPGIAQLEPGCSQCKLGRHVRDRQATDNGLVIVWGAMYEAFAYELTEAELKHLPPDKQMGAQFELNQHIENRRMARVMCERDEDSGKSKVLFTVRQWA